jgi:hypothetical protein
MGFKKTNSPIKQWAGSVMGNIANQVQVPTTNANTFNGILMGVPVGTTPQASTVSAQQQPINSGSMMSSMGGLINGLQNPTGLRNTTSLSGVSPAVAGPGNFTAGLSRFTTPQTNTNTRPQTPINPKALGNNTRTIQNMYGRSMPGSFNRNMGPLTQMTDPLTGQVIDPTMDQSTAGMNPIVQGDTAVAPPAGVEVPITPIYDINQ